MVDYLKDTAFLRQLDLQNLRYLYIRVLVLDKNEIPISSIQGQCTGGSINVNNNSPMRRTGNVTFAAEEKYNNLEDVENLLSINKRIKVEIGLENHINENYDDIIWFPQGIFIIVDPSISHNNQNGIDITLNFKDKMCLLNGECGGNLPASVTFHQYNQMQADGSVVIKKNLIYDIIHTLVHNYGYEAQSKIFINDLEKTIKQLTRFTGTTIYKNKTTNIYTMIKPTDINNYDTYNTNDDVGYEYVDLTYPGELISSIGDNVCSVLNKITETLGNYEYYYDVNGNFIWRQKQNYLNYSYDGVETYRLDVSAQNMRQSQRIVSVDTANIPENNLAVINETNAAVDFSSTSSSAYTFKEGSPLISAYSNTIQYTNIHNDFHVWGKNTEGVAIHYHLAIKAKPNIMNTHYIKYNTNEDGTYDGTITVSLTQEQDSEGKNIYTEYIPEDWRTELYLQGREQQLRQERPDMFTQEILDYFLSIFTFAEKNSASTPEPHFNWEVVGNPNGLTYWIDYLEPANQYLNYSVDAIGAKTFTMQNDKINKIYTIDPPNYIFLYNSTDIDHGCYDPDNHKTTTGSGMPLKDYTLWRGSLEGEQIYELSSGEAYNIYNSLCPQTVGYSAQEYARDLLYKYTDYNAAINITTMPIYYLEPNTTITVQDESSNIYGDYVINSFNIPLDINSDMSISATRALKRI